MPERGQGSTPDDREGEESAYEKSPELVNRFWKKMLDEHGISIKRMTELGKGGNYPVAFTNDRGNLDDSYLEKNRRVEFYLNK